MSNYLAGWSFLACAVCISTKLFISYYFDYIVFEVYYKENIKAPPNTPPITHRSRDVRSTA